MSLSERKENQHRIHELKLNKKYYLDSLVNLKTFEIRKNDRGFKVGDILKLMEYDPDLEDEEMGLIGLTGDFHFKLITYILDDAEYLREGYVCLGLMPLTDLQWTNEYEVQTKKDIT